MIAPRSVVPESIMPPYAFLADRDIDARTIGDHLVANTRVGVPYTEAMIANARRDMFSQAMPEADFADVDGLLERYGETVPLGPFDGNAGRVTEMDAIIAYLQMLGTLVDFSTYDATAIENLR